MLLTRKASNAMYLGHFAWFEDCIGYLGCDVDKLLPITTRTLTPLKVVPTSIAMTRERVKPPNGLRVSKNGFMAEV